MFIRLNVKPNPGACSYVYAWSSEEKNPHEAYKFMHTHLMPSLTVHSIPESCEDDYYVTFKTNVPLEQWKDIVIESEFNDHNRYSILKHNCAHAAAMALETAGIKLFSNQQYYDIFNRPFTFCRVQLGMLMPYDMYYLAKHEKLKQLHTSKSEVQYQFTALRVKLWINYTTFENEKKLVTNISNEIEKRHRRHPEHIEAQIDALMQTYQLVSHSPTHEESDAYLKASNQFKKRTLTNSGKNRQYLMMLQIFSLGLLTGIVGDFCATTFSFKSYLFKPLLTYPQQAAMCVPALFAFFKATKHVNSLASTVHSVAQPTELSDAMEALVNLRKPKLG